MCKVVDRINERYEQYFYHTITTCTFIYTYNMDCVQGTLLQYEDIWSLDNYLEKLMNCNSFFKYIFAVKHFFFLSKNLVENHSDKVRSNVIS